MSKPAKAPQAAGKPKPGVVDLPTDDASQLSQREKFIQAAAELGCEENFDRFEEALKVIVRAPAHPQTPAKPKR